MKAPQNGHLATGALPCPPRSEREQDEIDNTVRALWASYGNGQVNDDEATFLQAAAQKRRPRGRSSAAGHLKSSAIGRLAARLGSRFTPRQRHDRRTGRHHETEGGASADRAPCPIPVDTITPRASARCSASLPAR